MNLRDLEYLVALEEFRHFGRAASACFVSQPTLSTQLRKLETELGVELIERGPRQVLFTGAGEEVVRRARRILSEAEDIKQVSRQLRDPRSGTLRLGIFPTLAPYLLSHVVEPLAQQFPELEVLLTEEKSPDLLEQLRQGRLDAIVLALPVEDDSLHVEPLFREEFVLAAPRGNPLATGNPLHSKDLEGSDLLLLTDGHCLRDQALAVCQVSGAGERQGFQATSLETLRHMVAAGVGVTLLPRLAVSPPVVDNPSITLREFARPRPHRDVALVWRPASPIGGLLAEVAEVLRRLPDGLVEPLGRTSAHAEAV